MARRLLSCSVVSRIGIAHAALVLALAACSDDGTSGPADGGGSGLDGSASDTAPGGGGSGGGTDANLDGGALADAAGGNQSEAGTQVPDASTNNASTTSCTAYPKTEVSYVNGARHYMVFCDWITNSAENWCYLTSTCNGLDLTFIAENGTRGVRASVEPRLGITSASHGTLSVGTGIISDKVSDLPDATDITLGLNFSKPGSITFRFDGTQVTIKSYQSPR